ncbi:MAG: hypothetical protein RL728_794, partial [Bacteroidota bacterium]
GLLFFEIQYPTTLPVDCALILKHVKNIKQKKNKRIKLINAKYVFFVFTIEYKVNLFPMD